MRYPRSLVQGTFVRRYKRFFAEVEVEGELLTAHCANTGSMRGCTAPGAPVRLLWHDNPRRKLPYSLEQIQVDGHWIVVNTARPNQVVAAAIEAGRVPELAGYPILRRECRLGESRVDLVLLDGDREPEAAKRVCWVEVKNVTLVEDGVARFPDAVTARGTRHLRELMEAVARGHRAVLFLHVGHEGAERVHPAEDLDPVWAHTVREAIAAGVEVLAYRCAIRPDGLALGPPVPFDPGPGAALTTPGR